MLNNSPQFPNFKTFNIKVLEQLSSFISQYPIYSDFNLVSLITWGVNDSVQYSFINNNLLISLRDYTTEQRSYSLLGSTEIDKTLSCIFKLDAINALERVPESVVKLISNKNNFIIEHQRDEDDYVYNLKNVTGMNGPEYRNYRRKLSTFQKNIQIIPVLKKIAVDDQTNLKKILNLTKKWRNIREKTFQESSLEYYAIRRALHYGDKLPIDIWGLFDKEDLLGFIITQNIHKYTILHFEKANTTIPGIGAYLKHQVFLKLYLSGQRYLNYEQDLGIHGLREYKLSLSPDSFMLKYRIRSVDY